MCSNENQGYTHRRRWRQSAPRISSTGIAPGAVKFYTDHYIVGNSCRCVWAVREYPPSTEEQAILSQLADRSGVTLRIYHRLVESTEQRKIHAKCHPEKSAHVRREGCERNH